MIILAGAVYWPSTSALWDFWVDDNHRGSHGPLVLAICAWLLFRARHQLAAVRVRPSFAASGLLLLCSAAWLVFWRAGIQELHILLLPLLMGLAVLATLGFEAAMQVALPLGFLYFAVPAWGIFVGPLQGLTVKAVAVLAPLIGVPAQVQGNLVQLPGVGVFEIAGGCSGANFFTVALALAVLVGEIERASVARRALLVAVMGALAIVSNWIRVLVVIQAGYTTNMRHVLVTGSHYTFGWVLFMIIMAGFVWFFMRPSRDARPPNSPGAGALPSAPMIAYVLVIAALALMPLTTYGVVATLDSGLAPITFVAPPARAGWQGPLADEGGSWKPEFVGSHSQWHISYRDPAGHAVEVMVIGYTSQAQGRELVSSENSLLGAGSATTLGESTVELGRDSYIETLADDDRGSRSVMWSVYDIGGREFAAPLMSQLWYGMRSLSGAPYSALFAFRAVCEGSCDAARNTLRSFVETMGPDLLAAVTHGHRSQHVQI